MRSLLTRVLRRLLKRPPPAIAIAVHPFDLLHGTDTSGLLERQHLQTGHANDALTTAYFGVPPSRFNNAVERWRKTPGTFSLDQYRFIDLGCGKGRAVMLASCMDFRDVVGVELNPELAAIARSNLAIHAGNTVASIVCDDAPSALPGLLDGATLLYLYNPFKAPVLRQVLQAVKERSKAIPLTIDILYLYPQEEAVFQEFAEYHCVWREAIPLALNDEGDGISAATDPCSLYRLKPAETFVCTHQQPTASGGNPVS